MHGGVSIAVHQLSDVSMMIDPNPAEYSGIREVPDARVSTCRLPILLQHCAVGPVGATDSYPRGASAGGVIKSLTLTADNLSNRRHSSRTAHQS